MNIIKQKIYFYKNQFVTLEFGQLANQSDGSILLKIGKTTLLSTVVLGKEIKDNLNFVPLTIDYREKYFAGGKIPGGFIKREGKPSDEEILTMRIIDRLIRPFLSKKLSREIQIMITLLSYDNKILPDGLVGLAASSSLLMSGIHNYGPISQIRISKINDKIIINPSLSQIKKSNINLIIGGSYKNITMIEGEMNEITNKDFIKIIKFSHKIIKGHIKDQIKFFLKSKNYINVKKKKIKYFKNYKLKKIIKKKFYKKIYLILKNNKNKKIRTFKLNKILLKIKKQFNNIFLIKNEFLIYEYFNYYKKKIIKNLIFKNNYRLDGRLSKEIRNINCKINYLPGVHGSCLFTRGETQSLTTVTLGSSLDVNKIDNVVIENNEKFYLHYNFPPFSTGEVKNIRGISRREIGHGNLAKKSLINIIPKNIPYTIRIVSDILESNGSSSMATVCASTLALMDSGIKIKNEVAGIAIGLIKNKKKIIILPDILGEEDHNGEIDFKITMTKNGIMSCQMDVKSKEINILKKNILNKILEISKFSIFLLLNKMNHCLSLPRNKLKSTAPKFSLIKISKLYIGIIIGSGGKNIQKIQNYTNTNIIITEKNNLGIIEIFSKEKSNIKKAINLIKKNILMPKKGIIYNAKIKKLNNLNLLVEILNGIKINLIINKKNKKKIYNIYNKSKILKIKYLGK